MAGILIRQVRPAFNAILSVAQHACHERRRPLGTVWVESESGVEGPSPLREGTRRRSEMGEIPQRRACARSPVFAAGPRMPVNRGCGRAGPCRC